MTKPEYNKELVDIENDTKNVINKSIEILAFVYPRPLEDYLERMEDLGTILEYEKEFIGTMDRKVSSIPEGDNIITLQGKMLRLQKIINSIEGI